MQKYKETNVKPKKNNEKLKRNFLYRIYPIKGVKYGDLKEKPSVSVEEDEEEEKQEEETAEFEIDWDNVELEITDVEQDTILTDSTLSITKVWDVRNNKEISAKQFFSLPEGEIMSMRRELQLAITTDWKPRPLHAIHAFLTYSMGT